MPCHDSSPPPPPPIVLETIEHGKTARMVNIHESQHELLGSQSLPQTAVGGGGLWRLRKREFFRGGGVKDQKSGLL